MEEVGCLQAERVRVVVGDPRASKRRPEKQDGLVRGVLAKAKRAVKSKSGKALLRRRGGHLERSFCHVLDHGGLRRTTLRGCVNLTKRQIGAALTYNLSLLMRHLTGHGTPNSGWRRPMRRFAGCWGGCRACLVSLPPPSG